MYLNIEGNNLNLCSQQQQQKKIAKVKKKIAKVTNLNNNKNVSSRTISENIRLLPKVNSLLISYEVI